MKHVVPYPVPAGLIERFYAGISFEPNSGCWLWEKSIGGHGYGQVSWKRAIITTHRLSFAIHHGPIGDGLVVCHRCDTRPCGNPDHLFADTHAANMKDRDDKGRQVTPVGLDNPRSVLDSDKVRAIRTSTAGHSALARLYGVHHSAIQSVRNRKTWNHVA